MVLVVLKIVVVRDGRDHLIAWNKAANSPLEVEVYGLPGSEGADGGAFLTTYSIPDVYTCEQHIRTSPG